MKALKKKLVLATSSALFFIGPFAALAGEKPAPPSYDAKLAHELGADEYGMRRYVFVLLKTGPANITDPDRRRELFAGHQANISRLAGEGALVLAGPLEDESGKRGIFILNAENIAAAEAMVGADPAVAAGIFTPEYNPFYGSAALMQLNDVHKRLQRKAIE